MKKIKFTPRLLIVSLGLLLVVGGSAGLVAIMRSRESNLVVTPPASASSVTPTPAKKAGNYIAGNPTNIIIPSLNIDLSVIPGYYNTKAKTWTLTTDKVQYATITPQPNNQTGNTFLYGHYRTNVFASLHRIPANAEAVIKTDNGHTFTYELSAVHIVDPTDSSSVFDYQGPPILTIQTCTGLFFQNRQLFTFNLVQAA